jgi:hypothetical protein
MLKWICRKSVSGLVLAVGLPTWLLAWVLLESVEADPRQDFSFALGSRTGLVGERVRWMPLGQIERILKDRLKGVSAVEIPKVAEHLALLCRTYRFDPAFILAMIQAESGFRADAVSPAGAVGLMQLMPASAAVIAKQSGLSFSGAQSLREPRFNLTLAVSYLAQLRHRYRNRSPYFFIAAYNIGPGRLDKLLSRPSFKPVQTLKYYREIQKWLPMLWSYPVSLRSSGASSGLFPVPVSSGGNRHV